jgi:hypothetical protein
MDEQVAAVIGGIAAIFGINQAGEDRRGPGLMDADTLHPTSEIVNLGSWIVDRQGTIRDPDVPSREY